MVTFGVQGLHTLRAIGAAAAVAIGSVATWSATSSRAEAAVSPNFARYCATHHRGSFVNQHRATGQPLCTLRNRYSMLHYRVNIGEACRLTTGSRAFRSVGYGRYLCVGRIGAVRGPTSFGRTPDYTRYCRTYHRSSFVSYMRGTREPLCTVRTGRLSQMHYRINVAEACRLTTGRRAAQRVAVGRYVCL